MTKCKSLSIDHPEIGSPIGKCSIINARSAKEFMAIKEAANKLRPDKNVVLNGECPFFQIGLDQTNCPYYNL